MPLPDPEMRKFLIGGTADSVRAALREHVALGMEVTDGENGGLILAFNGFLSSVPASQQLKLTVRAANALIEEHTE